MNMAKLPQPLKLSKFEQQIGRDMEKGLYRPLPAAKQREFIEAAKHHVARRKNGRKAARINFRLTEEELARLKGRAEQVGLPYQSLIASVLHRYLNGSLVDVDNLKTIVKALKQPARSRKSA